MARHAVHVTVRKRNKYGLLSFNVYEKIVYWDDVAEEEVDGPVTPPTAATRDGEEGFVNLFATYTSSEDPAPADAWEVYAKEGSAPVIGVDPAVHTSDMLFAGTESGLTVSLGPYTPGATLHLIVVAKRSSDNERGQTPLTHVLAEMLDVEEGDIFGGPLYE